MKKVLLIISLFAAIVCSAQTNREAVNAFSEDVKIYGQASDKIFRQNDPAGSVEIISSLINRASENPEYSPVRLASYFRLRGLSWMRLKNYTTAETDYINSVELLENAGEVGRKDLSESLKQLSTAYYYQDKRELTINAINRCIENTLATLGSNHSETLDAYSMRSNYHAFFNNAKEAMTDRVTCFKIVRDNVERNFAYLTASERTTYWNKNKGESSMMFAFAHRLGISQDLFTDELYNQQLLSKSLLLTAESSLQRAIEKDAALSEAYHKIRALRLKSSDDRTAPVEAQAAMLEADRLERQLGEKAAEIHKFTDFLKVNVNDVRRRLDPDDIAVEFVDYPLSKDSVIYAALVLSPKERNVKYIPLLEKSELELESADLGRLIWKPILSSLKTTPRNIYFAPTGLLYLLPLESQTLDDGSLLSETFNVYRLSSTRWLAFEPDRHSGKDAVVYGGLSYDMDVNDLLEDSKSYSRSIANVEINDYAIDRKVVTSLKYLPGSLREVENIASAIKDAKIKDLSASILTGTSGTESSFKSLSGKRTKIIHLATHGFYSPNTADPMQAAGLCFAGANNKYNRLAIPEGVDDGILTASEAAEMDLNGLDLLILSACQSGLGNITADGVEGLQRGFKKAGCKSMIMSLRSVDDVATQMLMSAFYREFLSGKSKLEAFETAKRELKNNDEYSDSRYWASFILLDAID